MKKLFSLLLAVIFVMSISPLTLAVTKGTISKININSCDVTPVVLDSPYDHIEYELDDDIDYWDNDCFWIKKLNANYGTDDFDYFDETSDYILFWEFECDSDYTFTSKPTIKINGSTADVDTNLSYRDPNDPTIYYVYTTARKATDTTPTVIKFIDVMQVDTRLGAGDKVSQHLKYKLPSNPKYSVESAQWIDEGGEVMANSDLFEADCSYVFSLTLKANNPCTFYEDAIVTLNGSNELIGNMYVDYDDETLFHIETVDITPLDRDIMPKVYLLNNTETGNESGMGLGLYAVDIDTCNMAFIAQPTFEFYCMEEIDGYYYGYDGNTAFHIVDAQTYKVVENHNKPNVSICDLAYNTEDDCLYGVDADAKKLYRIDLATGNGTEVASFNFSPITLAYADGYFYIGAYFNGRTYKVSAQDYKVEQFSNMTEIKRKYVQTMSYSYDDDCLYTFGYCEENGGFLARIDMDGSYEIEKYFGVMEFTCLMFKRPEPTRYTVTFIDGVTGDVIEEQRVKEGANAVFPAPPEHEGYVFVNWDDDGEDIQSDMTITAQYEAQLFTVSFYDGFTGELISTDEVEYGGNATFPTPPDHESDGLRFVKWDDDGTNIKSNLVITALYERMETPPADGEKGDLNGDGKINTSDAVYILKAAAGMMTLDEKQSRLGDCNGDGKVNTSDAVMILKYAAGMISGF